MPKSSTQRFIALTNSRVFSVIVFAIGLGLLVFSGMHLWDWYTTTRGTAPLPSVGDIIVSSTEKPDEKPPRTDSEYAVPADQPRKIIIDSVGVQAYIQKVGKDRYGVIAAPSNVHFAGWYVNSVKPGEEGLSIIDGHVSGRYSSAIFSKLHNLQKDDFINVEFGDKSIRYFQVVDKQELPTKEVSEFLLTKQEGITSQLNLVTCGGSFNKKSSTYNKRLIIVTRRI